MSVPVVQTVNSDYVENAKIMVDYNSNLVITTAWPDESLNLAKLL